MEAMLNQEIVSLVVLTMLSITGLIKFLGGF
jgi:hypothetical protein